MPSNKTTAATATFADHEVIRPENKLRKAVSNKPIEGVEDDPIASAEAALAELSGEFGTWMDEDCERLDKARQTVVEKGVDDINKMVLFRAAHDIKGQAATLGFPAVASVADSLCRLIDFSPVADRIPVKLINQHVDAVRAIYREYARSDAKDLAEQLDYKLRDVTNHFLIEENKSRPDVLEQITGSPPLSPG